ncbi:hypothetical protein D3C87_1587290 [compost metagenome]
MLKIKREHFAAKVKSSVAVNEASLNYTIDTTTVWKERKWRSSPLTIKNSLIALPALPAGTTIWYVSVKDERGMEVSGELQWEVPNK